MKHLFRILILLGTVASARGATMANPFTTNGASAILLGQSIVGRGVTAPGFNPAGASPLHVYMAGTNTVTKIFAMPDVGGHQDYSSVNFRIWVDLGNQTNPPRSGNLVFDVPISILLGSRFRFSTNGEYEVKRNSRLINSLDASTNETFSGYVKEFEIISKMQSTNGFFAGFWDVSANDWAQNGYLEIYAEDNIASISPFRFHGKTIISTNNGYGKTNSAYYSTNIPGPGIVLGAMGSFLGWNYGPPAMIVNFTNAATFATNICVTNLFVDRYDGFTANDNVIISAPAHAGIQAATNRTMKISSVANLTNVVFTNCIGFFCDKQTTITMTAQQSADDQFAAANAGYFDTVTPIWTNAPGLAYIPSGGDDFWNNTYSLVSGQFIGYDFGTINMFFESPDYRRFWAETYQWFGEHSFNWSGTLNFAMPPNVIKEADYTIFYYAP